MKCIMHDEALIGQPLQHFSDFVNYRSENVQWDFILPIEMEYIEQLLIKHLLNKSSIILSDDIDFDGVSSAVVSSTYLGKLFSNIYTYSAIQHGINEDLIRQANKYDLFIIVDGGTNLEAELLDMDCDVLIIDHHNIDTTLNHHKIIETVNKQGKVKTLVHCNSKFTQGLQCISAGMLCYIVFHTFYNRVRTGAYESMSPSDIKRLERRLPAELDLFEVGAISLISDIVPIDRYVLTTLIHYFDRYAGSSEFVRYLIEEGKTVTLTELQWQVFPMINYTKRLKDSNTISMIYKYGVSNALQFLNDNRRKGRVVVDAISLYGVKQPRNNFLYIDATYLYDIYSIDISNFKGLMCNRVSTEIGMPVIVGISKDVDGVNVTEISVRSQGYDSLSYFSVIEGVDGGGHPPACGFHFSTDILENLLEGYDKYLESVHKGAVDIVHVNNIEEFMSLKPSEIALYNHYALSNLSRMQVVINNFDRTQLLLDTVTTGSVRGMDIEIVTPVGPDTPVLVRPTLVCYGSKKVKLEIAAYEEVI